MYRRNSKGVTLVEVVIGTALLGSVLVAVALTLTVFMQSAQTAKDKLEALYLAEAGIVLAQHLRSEDWANINDQTVDTDLYLSVSTSSVAFSVTPEVLQNEYTRTLILRELYRNDSGDIVSSTTVGANVDSDSRLLQVTVGNGLATSSLEAILTNVHD